MFFDKHGRKCNTLNGASVSSYKYNDKGLATEIAYDYVLGGPNSRVFDVRLCKYEYNSMGKLIREAYYDKNNKPVWNINDICRKEIIGEVTTKETCPSGYKKDDHICILVSTKKATKKRFIFKPSFTT